VPVGLFSGCFKRPADVRIDGSYLAAELGLQMAFGFLRRRAGFKNKFRRQGKGDAAGFCEESFGLRTGLRSRCHRSLLGTGILLNPGWGFNKNHG
jgi:hypothetical protein